MSKNRDLWQGLGFGYQQANGQICMIRCFECGRENYGPVVASGYCAHCGHCANPKKKNPEVISSGISKKLNKETSD